MPLARGAFFLEKEMKVFIASDHAAFEEKKKLIESMSDVEFEDLGTNSKESTHYPQYAKICAQKVLENEGSMGVLLCGSGIGVSMAANRMKGVRAALCRTQWDAEMSRRHNNANIICLGARVSEVSEMIKMIDVFFKN
jgi:ribose 5-phosphate isomerase B